MTVTRAGRWPKPDAARHGQPLAILRLSYAIDLRYGVLVDIASELNYVDLDALYADTEDRFAHQLTQTPGDRLIGSRMAVIGSAPGSCREWRTMGANLYRPIAPSSKRSAVDVRSRQPLNGW